MPTYLNGCWQCLCYFDEALHHQISPASLKLRPVLNLHARGSNIHQRFEMTEVNALPLFSLPTHTSAEALHTHPCADL